MGASFFADRFARVNRGRLTKRAQAWAALHGRGFVAAPWAAPWRLFSGQKQGRGALHIAKSAGRGRLLRGFAAFAWVISQKPKNRPKMAAAWVTAWGARRGGMAAITAQAVRLQTVKPLIYKAFFPFEKRGAGSKFYII